jgi:hypothetical protein
MTGGTAFNEVFFEDVRVPDDHRLGDVNQGWTVALTTLMNERASIGGGGGGGGMGMASATRMIEMMRHFGVEDDPVLRDELARLYTGFQVAKMTSQRALAKLRAGGLPGPEMSIGKLALTANLTATAEFAASVLGPRLIADTGEWGTYAWSKFVAGTPGMRIAGGSDETLRNIVAERVLGLPRPGIDDSAFATCPRSRFGHLAPARANARRTAGASAVNARSAIAIIGAWESVLTDTTRSGLPNRRCAERPRDAKRQCDPATTTPVVPIWRSHPVPWSVTPGGPTDAPGPRHPCEQLVVVAPPTRRRRRGCSPPRRSIVDIGGWIATRLGWCRWSIGRRRAHRVAALGVDRVSKRCNRSAWDAAHPRHHRGNDWARRPGDGQRPPAVGVLGDATRTGRRHAGEQRPPQPQRQVRCQISAIGRRRRDHHVGGPPRRDQHRGHVGRRPRPRPLQRPHLLQAPVEFLQGLVETVPDEKRLPARLGDALLGAGGELAVAHDEDGDRPADDHGRGLTSGSIGRR